MLDCYWVGSFGLEQFGKSSWCSIEPPNSEALVQRGQQQPSFHFWLRCSCCVKVPKADHLALYFQVLWTAAARGVICLRVLFKSLLAGPPG